MGRRRRKNVMPGGNGGPGPVDVPVGLLTSVKSVVIESGGMGEKKLRRCVLEMGLVDYDKPGKAPEFVRVLMNLRSIWAIGQAMGHADRWLVNYEDREVNHGEG